MAGSKPAGQLRTTDLRSKETYKRKEEKKTDSPYHGATEVFVRLLVGRRRRPRLLLRGRAEKRHLERVTHGTLPRQQVAHDAPARSSLDVERCQVYEFGHGNL